MPGFAIRVHFKVEDVDGCAVIGRFLTEMIDAFRRGNPEYG